MSWSIALIGTPEKVSEALAQESTTLQGQSKIEFDSALPHMQELVKQNFNTDAAHQPTIKIEANGYGYLEHGKDKYRTLNCKIGLIDGKLV